MQARALLIVSFLIPLQLPSSRADPQLTGIGAVSVAVEAIAPAAERLGVASADLRTEVERVLKAAGLRVSTADDGDVHLTVTVNAVPIETTRRATTGIAYTVTVSVDEDATVQRTGDTLSVQTWRRTGIGVSRPAQTKGAIRDQLKEYVDAFVSAWRATNNRK
jgi:hypothetical protein